MGLTLSVAAYCADKGIRCNAINPGGVQTDAMAALWLCCDDSEMINGALVPVDGGLSAF